MTADAKTVPAAKKPGEDVAKSNAKAPYPFRLGWAVALLALNLLVAAYYFHIIE
ncbi:photosystem I protein PsaX [Brasilonema sp. UFV-L1]|uniref:photosystem I protein PsaX n=1 Tax=Brasilonema sp. UFV-L1 TaxID=2234130 RepID=UPI00145C459D|nr:photosystem I protein PsaX [Brasilonema sp. UFV-L1]NMG08169.1 Photosystem I protein [Brasilonema sp. UFV-L1]